LGQSFNIPFCTGVQRIMTKNVGSLLNPSDLAFACRRLLLLALPWERIPKPSGTIGVTARGKSERREALDFDHLMNSGVG
jgi:hypothetical protein